MVFAWITVTVLYRPEVTAFQPWASRRLSPAVLPGFILLAVWAVGWLTGWLRRNGYGRPVTASLAVICAAALVLPTATTTFGLGYKYGGPLRIRPVAHGLALKTSYKGEIGAVEGLCAAIPAAPRSSSSIHAPSTRSPRSSAGCAATRRPTSRCGRTAWSRWSATSGRLADGAVAAGGQAVELTPYGGATREIIHLTTRNDQDTATFVPSTYRPDPIVLWLTEPSG